MSDRYPKACPAIAAALAAAQLDWGDACSVATEVWQDRLREALTFAGERERQCNEEHADLAELERTKAELEKAQTQRDAMFHEIETLRGKTGYCIGCEVSAQKLAKLREAGEALANRAKAYREWQKIPAPKWNHVERLKDILRDLAKFDVRAAVGGGEAPDA